jgi:hypothetical protein
LADVDANANRISGETYVRNDGWTATTVATAFKKDKYGNDATTMSYESYGIASTLTVGSYSKVTDHLFCLQTSGQNLSMSKVTDKALGGYEASYLFGYSYSASFFGASQLISGVYAVSQMTSIASVAVSGYKDTSADGKYAYSFGAIVDSSAIGPMR